MTTNVKRGADFSVERMYRYVLWRRWNQDRPMAMFIGLNPSTADEFQDDPTVRRCIGFASDWGYGGVYVLNIFALCSKDPRRLYQVDDPIGPENDRVLRRYADESDIIIAAWGAHGRLWKRCRDVQEYLSYQQTEHKLHHMGLTKDWCPRHPLYLRRDVIPQPWSKP